MKIDYQPDIDVLTIEKEEFQDFETNLELGGFILDLDSSGNFLGIEIIDASQKTPLSREELERIDNVEVNFSRNEEVIKVELVLEIDSSRNIISSQYPAAKA